MNKEIFSSTGELGISRRQNERLYVNCRKFHTNPEEVEYKFGKLTEYAQQQPDISRSIFRGLVNEPVMKHLSGNGLKSNLEVTVPVAEFTGENSWLIYMAKNKTGRELLIPREVMVNETSAQKREITPPFERVLSIVEQGYTFTSQIQQFQVDQVRSLWGETFGWKRHEVDNLRKRLISSNNNTPSQKDVWFSAVKDNDTIISAAMAERLEIPSAKGKLDLIESTEWRTMDNYVEKGIMTATVAALNAQILSDLQDNPNGLPLIYAECNFQSSSHRAGYGAGYSIPERTGGYSAPQILVQNVFVRDGQPVPDGKLRDFTFMYLPRVTIQNHYRPAQINSIKQMIKP